MRKFSKIVESRSELFSRLATTQEDIEEALVDLSDNGYVIDIDDIYISPSGKVHYDTVGVPEYYSALRIDIKRPSMEESIEDVRNWDGSVYYEKDINILEAIYHSITRLKSTFSGKAEVYYCFRSVNTISIRVIFNIETGKSVINFEDVSEYMNSLSNSTPPFDDIFGDNYFVEVTGSSGDKSKSVKISIPRKDYMDHGINITNPKVEIDRIVRSIIDDNKPDNKYQLKKIFDLYVKKLFQKSNISGKLSIATTQFDEVVFMNTETKKPVIKIDWWYDEYAGNNKVMTKKGVFKSEYKTFDIYHMSLTVNFIRK